MPPADRYPRRNPPTSRRRPDQRREPTLPSWASRTATAPLTPRPQAAPATPPRPQDPQRCPHCNGTRLVRKGSRRKKLETVQLFQCKGCGRTFAPGPRAIRNKTYPIGEILEAITTYSKGYSFAETARRLSSRYGHPVSPSTISRWYDQHPGLTTYRRLRRAAAERYAPGKLIRTTKLYHRQVYEFACHRGKLDALADGTLDTRVPADGRMADLAAFLEQVPNICPHDQFTAETAQRSSQMADDFLATDRLVVTESQNVATDTAALIIPSVGSNHERHARLQRFMLANDAATIAVEVPIWLDEDDIAALEDQHGIVLVPKRPVHPGRPTGPHWPRSITGHIDFLQVRGGAVHILDYKPDARTNKPVAQLTIYALALTRLVPGLQLFDI